jgi:hypothetical protein
MINKLLMLYNTDTIVILNLFFYPIQIQIKYYLLMKALLSLEKDIAEKTLPVTLKY